MTLSIVIINWNSAIFLKACLSSIYATISDITFEVIVIDNASYDGSEELLRKEFPQAKFVQSDSNLGFARANNLGYRLSSGRVLLFLNPDTEVINNFAQQLLTHLESDPLAGAAGCRILNSDMSLQTSCVQPLPRLCNQFLDAEVLKWLFPRWSLWGTQALISRNSVSVNVEMISGACLMVKRKVFEAVNQFSEEYFMYGDDVDLCYKISNAGYLLQYVGNAAIIHHGGKSSSQATRQHFADVMIKHSIWTFLRKTRGGLYAATYKSIMFVSAVTRVTIAALVWIMSGTRRARAPLGKWLAILGWCAGKRICVLF